MKRNFFISFAIVLTFCLSANVSVAQGGKPTYKVTIPGFSAITATDCAVMPIGATGGVVTITKAADSKTDQQFQTDIKNNTKIATMDVVMYDAAGKKTKSFHFTNLQVKSAVPNYQGVSAFGLSFDNETQD